MDLPVTGDLHVLDTGAVRLEVGSLAAVLRSLTVDGVQLVEDFDDRALPPFGAGIVLMPWPNRVRDGRWTHEGRVQQLDLTEPSKGNASHGLLRNTEYVRDAAATDSIRLSANVFPQHGWPFTLFTAVEYSATPNGMQVRHLVDNRGATRAPFAVGAHPYFRLGEQPIEGLTVTADLRERVILDDQLLPVGTEEVERGGTFDLTSGRRVGELDLNYAFRVSPRSDGTVLTLGGGAGERLELWQDDSFTHVQLYTPRDFPRADGHHGGTGLAFAAEPMTAPPDALNSGVDLIWLEPGETWSGSWGVRYFA